MKKAQQIIIRLFLVFIILNLLTGCIGNRAGDPTATSNAPTLPPAQPTIVIIDGTPQVVYEDQLPTPTANLDQANPVQLTELKFMQSGVDVSVAAKMINVFPDAIARDVFFEITARDENGYQLHQDLMMIKYVFPLETTGLFYHFELMPGFLVHNVELRVVSGVLDSNLKYEQALTITTPSLQKTETTSTFTAWLENHDPYTYTQVRLNAIAYNKQNQIIGGGTQTVDFVPHEEKIGIGIPVYYLADPEIDHVEIYPWITQYSASLEAGRWWDTIAVKDWSFEVNSQLQLGGGAVLQNLSQNLVSDTYYILTLSDEFGQVVISDMGYIDYIWPEEEIFFSPGMKEIPFVETYPEKTEGSQSRGMGVLARVISQEIYPIDDTPYPTETATPTIEPSQEPTKEEATPTPEPDLSTPEPPTPIPSPTVDPNKPTPVRKYPSKFTVDLIIVPGEFGIVPIGYNPLRASQAAFVDDNTARVSVVNNLDMDLTQAVVYVLVYDQNGQIVGGGKQISETIKSVSATEVDVPIAFKGERANLRLVAFATLNKNALNNP